MNRSRFNTFVGGALIGVLVTSALGAKIIDSKAVDEVNFPRRQNGVAIIGDDSFLAGAEVALEDLVPFPNTEETRLGRYQALAIEAPEGGTSDFLVLDTQTGMVRYFEQHAGGNTSLVIYNVQVPNHAISTRVQMHRVVP